MLHAQVQTMEAEKHACKNCVNLTKVWGQPSWVMQLFQLTFIGVHNHIYEKSSILGFHNTVLVEKTEQLLRHYYCAVGTSGLLSLMQYN